MGTPNREPQEYSRNIIEYKDPGRYIPIIFLLYFWGSLFGVPINVPLNKQGNLRTLHRSREAYMGFHGSSMVDGVQVLGQHNPDP